MAAVLRLVDGKHYNYFRDYDAAIGRYIESDPLGFGGGINHFGYVGANSLRYTDRLGLAPDCEKDSCCKTAISQGLLSGLGGSVVCCKGKKFACVVPPNGSGPGGPIIQGCAQQHEDQHLPEMKCTSADGPGLATSTRDSRSLECPAFRGEIKCLRDSINKCGGNHPCEDWVRRTIETKIVGGNGMYKCALR
jgi:hypothetical protein